jgi:hypothetical protein
MLMGQKSRKDADVGGGSGLCVHLFRVMLTPEKPLGHADSMPEQTPLGMALPLLG